MFDLFFKAYRSQFVPTAANLGNAISVDGKALNSINATDSFAANVGKNLVTGLARASITSAITGTDLETSIRTEVIASVLNAASAQGADWIGTQAQNGTLNEFGHAFAHAVAGCVAGAAGASAPGSGISGGSGCGAGALGAAVGELSAGFYNSGREAAGLPAKTDTVQFASMISGIVAAATGQGAQGVAIASGAGANAAQNNRLMHWGDYLAAKDKCKNAASSECTTLQRMAGTQSQVLDFMALPDAKVVGNFGPDGKVVSYTLFDKQTRQPTLIMEPLEFEAYRNATPGLRAMMALSPQWSLDASSMLLYGSTGNTSRALESAKQVVTNPGMWVENALGVLGGAVAGSEIRAAGAVAANSVEAFAADTAARQVTAKSVYQAAGWPDARIASHLEGIDFSQAVETVILPKGTKVVQYQIQGNPTGNYFAPVGTSAESVGVNPTGRVATIYTTTSDVSVLRSTAANTLQNSNLPVLARGQGGGVQFFTTNPSAFTPLP